MGSNTLICDHNIIVQLWDDLFFWESVSGLEDLREEAEIQLEICAADRSSLQLKHTELYTEFIGRLRQCAEKDQEALKRFTDYVHSKRKNRQESISIPDFKSKSGLLVVSNGVDK